MHYSTPLGNAHFAQELLRRLATLWTALAAVMARGGYSHGGGRPSPDWQRLLARLRDLLLQAIKKILRFIAGL